MISIKAKTGFTRVPFIAGEKCITTVSPVYRYGVRTHCWYSKFRIYI